MEKDIDMSGVDPVRVPEIRRRVAVLDEYVAVRRPSADVRKSYAERLGLSVSQLYYLARVWRIERNAANIPGARSKFTAPRPRRLDPRVTGIAQQVIDELGPTSRRMIVLAEVARRCAEASIDPPSNSTVTNMLAAARSTMVDPTGLAPKILIDEVTAKLPVLDGDTVTMPRVLVAVMLPQRRIIAAEIGCGADTPPSLTALMKTIKASARPDGVRLPIRARHVDDGGLADVGANTHHGADDGPGLSQVLGNELGGVGLLYRPSMARPGSVLAAARHASPISGDEAHRIIRAAIAEHNAALSG